MKIATPNYTNAQVDLIRGAAVNGVLNLAIATSLAANPAMDAGSDTDRPGPRNARSIVAKISRMVTANDTALDGTPLTYERKVAVAKDGSPVSKKTDIVAAIAKSAGVAVAKLDGLDKSPKLALTTLRDAFAARVTG
jgi:hypothetical protein